MLPLAEVVERGPIARDLLDPIGNLDLPHQDLSPLRSMLSGPGPKIIIKSSPPISVRLCMKKSVLTFCSFASAYVQKLWNVSVTGIKNRNSARVPSRAL